MNRTMIYPFESYPAYKPSGVNWLGEVPEHWQVRKLRRTLRAVAARNRSDLPLLSVVREKGVMLRDVSNKDENHNFIPDDLTNYKVVQHGQFAMNKMKAWQGSYGVSKFDGIVSPAYFVFDLDSVDGNYFHTAIRSKAYVPYFTQASDGVRIGQWDLSLARIREIPFLVPPLSEQAAIVRFLDHADRRIRSYIRAKQKLITLLEEQKQAVINRVVTRGLDPNIRLKPSGVEWLGDMPAHWEIHQLGRVGRFFKGVGGTKEDEVPNGVPCVRYGDLYMQHQFFIRESRSRVSEQRAVDYTPIQYGDVLFAGSGETIEEIGKSAVNLISHRACCGGDVIIFRLQIEVNARFLGYATDCSQAAHQKSRMGRGITVMHIYGNELKYMWVAIPPLPEQAAIVRYLDKATSEIDAAIDRARRQIELLSEYRTRLIADVVTGKLDVREAVARLPDEPEEMEPLNETDALTNSEEEPTDDLVAAPEEAEA